MSQSPHQPSTTRAIVYAGGLTLALLITVGIGQANEKSGPAPAPSPPSPAQPPPSQVAGGGFTLTSVSAELPDDEAKYPDGPGADTINANCLSCHSAAMALTQPRLSQDQWKATVEKMRNAYKAPVAEKDVPTIVQYLTTINAKLATGSSPAAGGGSAAAGAASG